MGYVYNEHLNQATGEHFNSKGHSVADMEVTILEKIFSRDPQVRKERESLFIKKFNSKHKGLNKNLRCGTALPILYFTPRLSYIFFFLVQKYILICYVFTLLTQSDDECIKHSKYITDRALRLSSCEWEYFSLLFRSL